MWMWMKLLGLWPRFMGVAYTVELVIYIYLFICKPRPTVWRQTLYRQTDKQTNRRNVGPTPIVIGEHTRDTPSRWLSFDQIQDSSARAPVCVGIKSHEFIERCYVVLSRVISVTINQSCSIRRTASMNWPRPAPPRVVLLLLFGPLLYII